MACEPHIYLSISSYLSLSVSLYFSISPFLYFILFLYLSIYLCESMNLSYLSIYLTIYLSIYLFIYLFIYFFIYPICRSLQLSIYWSTFLSALGFAPKPKTTADLLQPCQIVSGNSGRTWFMVQMPPTRMRLFKSQFYKRRLHVCFQKRRCLGCIDRSSTVCFSKSDCRTSSCVI